MHRDCVINNSVKEYSLPPPNQRRDQVLGKSTSASHGWLAAPTLNAERSEYLRINAVYCQNMNSIAVNIKPTCMSMPLLLPSYLTR